MNNNITKTKKLICDYCESGGAKCEGCELNSAYTLNFQLGKDAKFRIEKGTMTCVGAEKTVLELNAYRHDAIKKIFDDAFKEEDDEQRVSES